MLPGSPMAAALYGSALWPSFNAILHYQRLAVECQQLGLSKLVPCSDVDLIIPPSVKKGSKIMRFENQYHFLMDFCLIENPSSHPLDLCTKKDASNVKLLTNNNTKLVSTSMAASSSAKAIWSPASSCEEENRNQVSCTACQRTFASPTKLELHLRKFHTNSTSSNKPSNNHTTLSSSSRRERIFKVSSAAVSVILLYVPFVRAAKARDRE